MEHSSFLSPSVRNLLFIASNESSSKDETSTYLTDRWTFNWENIAALLHDNRENPELSADITKRSSEWFTTIITSLAPVFESAQRLCVRAATVDQESQNILFKLWQWTGCADELLNCFRDTFISSSSSTAAVESMLVLSSIMEHSLGNILRNRDVNVPFLLRDLLREQLLYDIFGNTPLQFTRLLVGMPMGLNARNLVWHGFVAPDEMSNRIPAAMLILLSSLGNELCNFDPPLNVAKISGINELPHISIDFSEPRGRESSTVHHVKTSQMSVISGTIETSFQCLLPHVSALKIIPPKFLPFWKTALERYSAQKFGHCLVLLLPQIELILRIGFCIHNKCPKRLLTAVQASPHTTFDDMLVETVDNSPNTLCHVLGEGLLCALFDLLQRPSGPRIRDRLGHGELPSDKIPKNLTDMALGVAFAIAGRLSQLPEPYSSFWDTYSPLFHPIILLRKASYEILELVEKVDTAVLAACALIDESADVVYLFEPLEQALGVLHPDKETVQLLNVKQLTLFRPKNEIIVTVALWRTVRSLCVVLETAKAELERRSVEVEAGRLRSRQRKTLQRMIEVMPTLTRGSVCLVILAQRIRTAVASAPENYIKWQRCIGEMEKYAKKLASYAGENRNRWNEMKNLASNFCKFVVPLVT